MMTQINLLPNEWRKKEMTPLATLVPILCGFTVVVGAAFFWGWIHFAELARAEQERDEVQSIHDTLRGQTAYAGRLKGEAAEYGKREDTIAEIRASRVPWTRKLDELWDVVVDDEGGKRYLVRFDSLKVAAAQAHGRAKKGLIPGDEVVLSGVAFNEENPLGFYNQFHETLKGSDFFIGDFETISPPAGKAVDDDSELVPRRGWTVNITMQMKDRELKPNKTTAQANARAGR